MNKKKLLYLFTGVLTLGGTLFLFLSEEKTEIEILRERHAQFLKKHKFQNTMNLSKEERKSMGLPPNAYFEQKYLSEIDPSDGLVHKENIFKVQEELKEFRNGRRTPGDGADNPWIERGPDNVGGRTRAIIFDPNDSTNETVFAGGVSGGLWKNTNISSPVSKWERVGIPENLSVTCIAVDPNNSNVFYVGTGESYVDGDVNGDGVWKSTDGGASWSHLFGGRTGDHYLDSASKLTINSPANLAGDYSSVLTTYFGGDLSTPITQDLVLVEDGTNPAHDACEDLTNPNEVNGKIALIKRGSCNFTNKVLRAQEAGAVAVIMINNIAGFPFEMQGTDASITIPAVMVSKEDGDALISSITSGVNVTLSEVQGALNTYIVPGVQHINDIVVRDVNGQSEVYVAAGEAGYFKSIPSAIIGADSFGLYRSTDGTNFTQLNLPNTSNGNKYEPNNIEMAADNTIYLSSIDSRTFRDGGGAIFHSTNGTDFNLKYTVPSGLRTEIALSSSNANVGYILAETGQSSNPVKIYKTTDGFLTAWETSLPDDADTGIPSNDFTRGQAFYDLIIKVDPSDDNIVYVGGIDIFKSFNSGSSWTQLSHWYGGFGFQYAHADQHGIAFGTSDRMLFSNDGGVYYSSNSGNTIQARNRNYNTLQFYTIGVAPTTAFGGDEYFLAGAQDNGTQLISNASDGINSSNDVSGGDGAASFFDTDGTDKYYVTNYVFNQAIDLYDYNTDVRRSINSEDTANGDFINQADLDSNLDILYTNYSTRGEKSVMRYSNIKNGVISRRKMTNGLLDEAPSAFKVSPYTTSSSKVLAGLKNGKLLLITEANIFSGTWSEITGDGFVGSVSDIEFGANENEIFVTMHNYGVENVWYSNDGGTSWSGKEGNLPDIPVKTILQNPLNREEVIVGTDIGVWKTSNFSSASPSWTQSYNGMSNVPVLDLDLRDDNTVFAATYGRGIFSGKFTAETASVKDVINGVENFTVYPTISEGKFTVYGKGELGNAKMDIYNINGQEVYTKKIDFTSREQNEVEVSLNSGVYIVNVTDSQNRKSSKKIIIK